MKAQEPAGVVVLGSRYFDLVQQAYRVFKQGPADLGVCDCCMDSSIRKNFFMYGQSQLPASYVHEWFFAAADMPLNREIWRYLLPRILEMLLAGQEPSATGLEVTLDRYPTGKPENWSVGEWEILDQFQKIFLSNYVDFYEDFLDDIACMFVNAGWSAEEIFDQIWSWPTEKIVTHLWNDWCRFPRPSIWITTFWEDSTMPLEFYTSEKLASRITNYALEADTPKDIAAKAMSVSDVINWAAT